MDIDTQIKSDYDFALFTLLWANIDEKSYLMFGTLDFFPNEIKELSEVSKCNLSLKSKDNVSDITINFFRKKMTSENALAIYHSCRQSGKFSVSSEQIYMEMDTSVIPSEIGKWPNLTLGKRSTENLCPFVAETWGCCRMHHILPNAIAPTILDIIEHERPITWIRERLLWDISLYPELLGSMHLILPNPLIRSISERMIPEECPKVAVNFQLRQDKTLKDLKNIRFLAIERDFFGIAHVQEFLVDNINNNVFYVPLSGKNTGEFGIAVYDTDRGLLEWSSFGNFIMGLNIDMRVANAKRQIILPNNKKTLEVTSYEKAGNIKAENVEDSWGKRLRFQQLKRTNDKYAKKFGQHLFKEGTSEESEVFMRELIGQTKNSITIIDPFFATLELFKYILTIPSPVHITIITGADVMNYDGKYSKTDGENIITGKELLNKIEYLKDKLKGYDIEVKVMTGDNIFHDRFLIIDDDVWFSGNSLNNIGKRASMLIRLPNPQEFLNYLNELLSEKSNKKKRIFDLEEWLKKAEKSKEKTSDDKA